MYDVSISSQWLKTKWWFTMKVITLHYWQQRLSQAVN